jgi:hypothetical protein
VLAYGPLIQVTGFAQYPAHEISFAFGREGVITRGVFVIDCPANYATSSWIRTEGVGTTIALPAEDFVVLRLPLDAVVRPKVCVARGVSPGLLAHGATDLRGPSATPLRDGRLSTHLSFARVLSSIQASRSEGS